ncbi:nitrite reductase small subunit NirD [Shouchella patagoniensis]|uniref:nitrite reductase small subunit NirD n=1 Tax=Shouchella patagoniensis TaxID=228576 RepID=UPI000995A85D|nr:nitrite reductase small subunit NirD [Shouchella patagoniensis]
MTATKEKKKIFVADRNELSIGLGKQVSVDGVVLALFLQSDGTVNAIENACPHKGGPLSDGIVSGEHVFCPLHDWKISTKTGMAQGADKGCVTCFEVEVNNGKVYVFV